MIALHDPKPEWAAHALAFARLLRATLGARPQRIHHIGSTAVPGLAAEDIVDMQVTLPDLGEDRAVSAALDALGFSRVDRITGDHLPPGATDPARWAKRLYTLDRPRRIDLHIRVEGAPNAVYALLFRDYLRATPAAAAAYGTVKRQLAAELADDQIVDEARRWAETVGWKVPATEA
jgi:GrpB-like predicted nucleotidyltransferase (UPF0157 family)